MGVDPLTATLLAMFGSAVAALFGAYTFVQQSRTKGLEEDLGLCRKEIEALKEENAEYVALFVLMKASSEEELRVARERVAAILRRQKGYPG